MSPSGPLFLQGQKAPDPTVALHSWHPQKTPIRASAAFSQFVMETLSILVGQVFMCYIPSPVKCDSWDQCQELAGLPISSFIWSWEEECGAHQAPLSPMTVIRGLTGH